MSGAGSVFDIQDCGSVLQAQPIDSGTVSSPDAFGRIQISLVLSTSGIGGIGLAGYIVDGNRVQMVENNNDLNDVFFGVTGGTAFAQSRVPALCLEEADKTTLAICKWLASQLRTRMERP
jgi:hypothetical protein